MVMLLALPPAIEGVGVRTACALGGFALRSAHRPDGVAKGKSGFQLRGGGEGGGGSIEPPKTGGLGKGAQLTGP